ncbi:hypothetical protein [Parenemella sanctibonifatiensis]|uniref:Uncharacterized protein n=1 Tax=Parenemella sanctibonifatiensis TaxID=2016505 RepID=A0A255EGZ5_9ACTN|nr:hypothetical protein [Parenemella sanctibonifatiensis]OYN90500.1 hypothetical protein CGZ92_01325 [Parenemella sanctibonifatiensis]
MQSLSPRSLWRLLASLLIATAGLLGSTAYAQSPDPDEVSIEGVDFTYWLGRDADGLATLQVTEVWRINFPASGDYSNFNRDIPRHYRDADVWGEEPTAQAS